MGTEEDSQQIRDARAWAVKYLRKRRRQLQHEINSILDGDLEGWGESQLSILQKNLQGPADGTDND